MSSKKNPFKALQKFMAIVKKPKSASETHPLDFKNAFSTLSQRATRPEAGRLPGWPPDLDLAPVIENKHAYLGTQVYYLSSVMAFHRKLSILFIYR